VVQQNILYFGILLKNYTPYIKLLWKKKPYFWYVVTKKLTIEPIFTFNYQFLIAKTHTGQLSVVTLIYSRSRSPSRCQSDIKINIMKFTIVCKWNTQLPRDRKDIYMHVMHRCAHSDYGACTIWELADHRACIHVRRTTRSLRSDIDIISRNRK
jgi:hypothetical protein